MGLRRMACPAARAALGLPAFFASHAYVRVSPYGIARHAAQHLRWNAVPAGVAYALKSGRSPRTKRFTSRSTVDGSAALARGVRVIGPAGVWTVTLLASIARAAAAPVARRTGAAVVVRVPAFLRFVVAVLMVQRLPPRTIIEP